jgi:diamine N-acetyltransferase
MPLLNNETIALRALEPEDLDSLYRWENDPELWQYGSTLAPYSRFVLRDYLSSARQHDVFQARQLRLMIVETQSKRPVGTVDLYDLDPVHLRAGVGILIDSPDRGKGRGKQTLQLLHEYASKVLMLHQLYAYIPETNVPSRHLFGESGYVIAGRLKDWVKTTKGYSDVYLMQRILEGGLALR